MKKREWYQNLNLADDNYLDEANPNARAVPTNKKYVIKCVLAAAACFALVMCNFLLFLPFRNTPPDVSRYKNSPYYGVIQKLNVLTWEKPKYNNNFEIVKDTLSDFLSFEEKGFMNNSDAITDAPAEVPEFNGENTGNSIYEEVTDNQVEGIIEADRIKRSDKYIYYLDDQTLRVFSIAGLDSKELGHIDLIDIGYNQHKWEFYLSKDCKTATVIIQYLTESKQLCVGVIGLDVSDPANIRQKSRVDITGNYMSSRMTDGKLLLLTEFVFQRDHIDFDDESTFLPQIDTGSGMQTISADGIISPEEINSTRYTIVMKLDENTLKPEGTAAYLSYSEDVYVSKDHIFLTRVFADIKNETGYKIRNAMTEIACLTYSGSTFEKRGSAVVRGYVKDQWSMDEYEGILRVVTTTNATTVGTSSYLYRDDIDANILVTATGRSNASLYCVDLESFQIVASVVDFAPPHEEVQSVRFDKHTAYVCTSIEMSDPVFFFDLSDLNNITYKDTGTIEGFSTSLVNFGDGNLLGIGQSDWNTFKVEIYQETKDGVQGFCKYERKDVEYSTAYKSYYIDRENRLIGLGIRTFEAEHGRHERYIVLFFDGYNLVEVVNTPLQGDCENQRGVYIDGYMYMFGLQDFKVEKVF